MSLEMIKETVAVDDVGPASSAALISFSVSRPCKVLIINGGADPINYFVNKGVVSAFDEDSFTLATGESVEDTFDTLADLFFVCNTGGSATVRYKVTEIPLSKWAGIL